MTNSLIISLYAVLALASISIMFLTLRKPQRSKLDKSLLFIAAMLLCWELCEIAFYSFSDTFLIQTAFDVKLPFVNLVALSWLLYVIRFYGNDTSFTKPVMAAMFVIPLFTMALALTTTQHDMLREQFSILSLDPVREFVNVRGPWFWYHSAYCYLLVVAGLTIAIVNHRKVPKEYRTPSTLLIIGLVVSALGNIAVVFATVPFDLSLVGGSVTAVILYVATKNYPGLSFLIEARKDAFHHIKEAVFILNKEREIINMNRAADLWLDELDVPASCKFFPQIMEQLQKKALRQNGLSDEDAGEDYRLESGIIYNIKKKSILNNEQEEIASFVFVSDETKNRELIEHLDRYSGIDALTGLSNRRSNEEELLKLDKEAYYPLGVLYGDLNNLKEVNDSQGHHQGDVLLRLVAESLKTACPPSAHISRVGGDEFVVLLPGHADEQVQELSQHIYKVLEKESEKYSFEASIALGHCIKHIKEQPMLEVIKTADENMYAEKKRMKGLA